MRKLGAVVSIAVGAMVGLVGLASPAGAAHASGCSVPVAASLSKDGRAISSARAPGSGGTFADPFQIDTDGRVQYRYRVVGPIGGGHWTAAIDTGVFGDISFSGSIKSTAAPSGRGLEPLEKHLEISGFAAIIGKMKVTITATGKTGAQCTVSGWIKLRHSILTTPAFYLALILLLGALVLGYFAMATP
jgi:hypothetical protein